MPRKRKKLFVKLPPGALLTGQDPLDVIGDHCYVVLAHLVFVVSALLLAWPVLAFLVKGEEGAFLFIMIALITSPMSIPALKAHKDFSIKKLSSSFLFLAEQPAIQHMSLFVINFWLFLRIGLQTRIPLISLLELYLLSGLLFSVFMRDETLPNKSLIGLSLVPFIINLLLMVNYLVSFHPVSETHLFNHTYQRVEATVQSGGMDQRSSLIRLRNDKHDAYPGIRMFWDFQKLAPCSKITYTFKTGLFGIRVMTDYHFV